MFGKFLAPFARPAGVARRNEAEPFEGKNVFFALDHMHRPSLRGQELRKVERHAPDMVEVPNPAAAAIGPPLAKVLGLEAHDLEKHRPVLVGVGIDRDGLARIVGKLDAEIGLEPGNSLAVGALGVPLDQRQHTAAGLVFVIEPNAFCKIDRKRAARAITPFGLRAERS